ncbi:chitinase-like protein Idgf5 [Scaptodrosophila lebanonensis]|uniref:Chitinase-like protein Idgf5 n=1 Tax=Drosophila lebanonensis TaxID=7225 RepID=A0A6J2U054_DROLE|nr:chitinase-like protein Idgf5 [Scaptodrosophila lebanonensis]
MPNSWISVIFMLCLFWHSSYGNVGKLVCYYDGASFVREGPAQLSLRELEIALGFCNILVYGYAGIDAETFKLKSLNPQLTYNQDHYRHIIALKQKFPHVRFLLSVGGDRDLNSEGVVETETYLRLLEEPERRNSFKLSAIEELRKFGFDGLDLAWQFPKNKPKVERGAIKKAWHAFKGWFKNSSIDEKAEEHKEQFATLLRELAVQMQTNGILSLTMLPHVDASLFIDVASVMNYVDFVNLGTYDFQTPERNPKVADIPAPLYAMYDREPSFNLDYQVQYWINQTANAQKLHIGVATYARAWLMSRDSGITGYPPIPATEGAAPMGKQTGVPGLLSWPEVCELLQVPFNKDKAPLRKVGDPTKRFGIYAYHAAEDEGEKGIWVGYEDPTSAAIKAGYVHAKGLGGVALFDISLDDFRGQCADEKYPILRSIKYKL